MLEQRSDPSALELKRLRTRDDGRAHERGFDRGCPVKAFETDCGIAGSAGNSANKPVAPTSAPRATTNVHSKAESNIVDEFPPRTLSL
jgi:hypothetical protein